VSSTDSTWSWSTGERGRNRVRVYEDAKGRRLIFADFYEAGQGGALHRRRVALGHRDRERAKVQAEEIAVRFRKADMPRPTALTLAALFDIYEREVTPKKSPSTRQHDRRAMALFLGLFGRTRMPATLNRRDWDRFILLRRSGALRPPGSRQKNGVRNRIVAQDLKLLLAVLNWAAMGRDEQGALLLERNPLKGLPLPVEASPVRTLFTDAEYKALSNKARAIDPLFELALVVAHETGHRIGAIRQLRWSDIDVAAAAIQWRGAHDKSQVEHRTPITAELVRRLTKTRRNRLVVGDAWVFPSPSNPERPCSRHLMRHYMERGLDAIGITRGTRFGWHSLRRKFATDLKHVPLPDLCALGGWKDPQTILTCYQQPDERTMRQALAQRRMGRSRS
jgi:integrase